MMLEYVKLSIKHLLCDFMRGQDGENAGGVVCRDVEAGAAVIDGRPQSYQSDHNQAYMEINTVMCICTGGIACIYPVSYF